MSTHDILVVLSPFLVLWFIMFVGFTLDHFLPMPKGRDDTHGDR